MCNKEYRYEVFSWYVMEGFFIRYQGDSWVKSWLICLWFKVRFSGGTKRRDYDKHYGWWG